ncbi:MAG TPA: DUF4352 domain-containing protein [Pseudogracilibacillus sp.]|nr:DUF4352 domain-containing protein [Pseudogracilibacillus sp.]
MFGFLGLIAFILFVVFGIMWIVSLVKKNGKATRNIIISAVSFVVLIFSVVAGIGGAIGDALDDTDEGPTKVEESDDEDSNDSDGDDKDEEENIENTEFGVGEQVKLDGQVVEVTKVEKSDGDELERPSDGKEFVIVHVSIENHSDDEISYNPLDFRMKNSDGQIEDQGITMIDSDTALSSGELSPDGNVSGTLSFEQPIDDEGLQLIFEPSFWSEDKIVFNLS